ncbi:hypothetical protein EJ110_NYTH27299 [Nymphaea thermarum]|nr:hypothetical protein EJ110_NYTH27299 [Nymphaea thermarum]
MSKRCPHPYSTSTAALSNLFAAIQCTCVAAITDGYASAWELHWDVNLLTIIYMVSTTLNEPKIHSPLRLPPLCQLPIDSATARLTATTSPSLPSVDCRLSIITCAGQCRLANCHDHHEKQQGPLAPGLVVVVDSVPVFVLRPPRHLQEMMRLRPAGR